MSKLIEKKTVFVKAEDVFTTMTDGAGNASAFAIKGANASGRAWGATVLYLGAKKDFASYDKTAEVKDIATALRDAYKKDFVADWNKAVAAGKKDEELDKTTSGKNARTGESMKVMNGKGEIKWSSWSETRLGINYCGEIAKAIKAGLAEKLIVKADTAASFRSIMDEVKEIAKAERDAKAEGSEGEAEDAGTETAEKKTGIEAIEEAIAIIMANVKDLTADEAEKVNDDLGKVSSAVIEITATAEVSDEYLDGKAA